MWSTIKRYQWTEQGTLIINPGWRPITCLIPEDSIADVAAVLKVKLMMVERTLPA